MRNLIWRFGFLLPAAIFVVYVLMAVFGVVSSLLGATTVFYCTVYCKVGLALIIAAVAAVWIPGLSLHDKKT